MLSIIRDTQEKLEFFTFSSYGDVSLISRKLATGDYSLEGLEDKITVDRKRNSGELYLNFGVDKTRLNKEFERMHSFEEAYFVCSFPFSDLEIFPERSGIPKHRWRYLKMAPAYLKRVIKETEERYENIKFIFCDDQFAAEEVTYNILKKYKEQWPNKKYRS